MVFWCTLYWHSFFSANGNLCWWWDQVDSSRSCTGIFDAFFFFCNIFVSSVDCLFAHSTNARFHCLSCSTTFCREKPQIEWPSWHIGLQSGCHFCQECDQSCWAKQVTYQVWAELLSWTSYFVHDFYFYFSYFYCMGKTLSWLSFLLCQVKINIQTIV